MKGSGNNPDLDSTIETLYNIPDKPVEPSFAGNNSSENEISSEQDESVVSNKQADLSEQSDETLLDDDAEFISVEPKSYGKLLDILSEGVVNDTTAIKSAKEPAKEIPDVPVAVGVFDRLKYIFGF